MVQEALDQLCQYNAIHIRPEKEGRRTQTMGKRTKRQTLDDLPVETIEEILINSPVKSLLRFKCVSKSWRCLISSKFFVTEHLKRSSSTPDLAHLISSHLTFLLRVQVIIFILPPSTTYSYHLLQPNRSLRTKLKKHMKIENNQRN